MKRRILMLVRPVIGLVLLLATLPFGGCDEYNPTWILLVDSTALYSLSRPEYIGRVGAYDFARAVSQGGGAVVVERPKGGNIFEFDFAVGEIDGALVALPGGLFEGFDIEPGIAMDSSGVAFEEWDLAPRDGYVTDAPVPLRTDVLYAVKSRRSPLDGCTHYGKFQVLSLDPEGVVELQAVRNRLCNDRELIPPDEG
jgi:hypothetical protein